MRTLKALTTILLFGMLFIACNDDDDDMMTSDLNVNIDGLQDLGDDYAYEGWIMVDGSPMSTGTFTVDSDGNMSETSFEVDETNLSDATAFILTIEPSPDNDAAPSDVKLLAGDFSGSSADLSISHDAALGTDFSSAAGSFILATPTNGNNTDENSGIWFLELPMPPSTSLVLPDLPAGWTYEGWAVSNGTPLTTGKFDDPSAADQFDAYSGGMMAPPFPGEDFLQNAPSGVSFPLDLSGGMGVISVEPVPDNSPMPFVLKPLVGSIPNPADDHNNYMMANNASQTNPEGTASR
jgi:hypothetical protein